MSANRCAPYECICICVCMYMRMHGYAGEEVSSALKQVNSPSDAQCLMQVGVREH